MKRPRPLVPLVVRYVVAQRQVLLKYPEIRQSTVLFGSPGKEGMDVWLQTYLALLANGKPLHLDHDPALINRKFNPKTGKYTPDANDPDYLVYRPADEHDIKTRVHGEHGQHSDLALRRKLKRIARNRNPKRRKYKWPSRPFRKRVRK